MGAGHTHRRSMDAQPPQPLVHLPSAMQDSGDVFGCITAYVSSGRRPKCATLGAPCPVFSTSKQRASPLVNCQHGIEILLDARDDTKQQPAWAAAPVAEHLGSEIKECKWKASGPQREPLPNTIQSVYFTCRRHGTGKEQKQHDHIEASYVEQTTVHLHWRIGSDCKDDFSVQLLRWTAKSSRSHTAPCKRRRVESTPTDSTAVAIVHHAAPRTPAQPNQQVESLARCIRTGDDSGNSTPLSDVLANAVVPFSIQPGSFTMLGFAAKHRRVNMVRALLAAGALPGGTRENGATALHEAAYRGDVAIVKLLLDAGADLCAATRGGWW